MLAVPVFRLQRFVAGCAAAMMLACTAVEASTLPLARPGGNEGNATASLAPPVPAAAPVAHPGTFSKLSAAGMIAAQEAFAEADQENWTAANRYAAQISDPVAVKLLTWTRLLSDKSNATFAEIVAFREQNPGWPRMQLLAIRAETALLSYPMTADDILVWFGANPPQTGEGRIRYGETLIETGRQTEGAGWIRRAWVDNDFTSRRQSEILKAYGRYLTVEAQQARLARLLWEQRTGDARTTAALVGAEARALADARIQFIAGSSKAQAALSQVPAALRTDAGLLYDRVRYERRRGNEHTALPLLLTAPTGPLDMVRPDSWWVERKILTRKALSEGLYPQAYRIASAHGLTEGVDFAEAEFLSGWIALQYLNRTEEALSHFRKLGAGVSTPISKSRAEYWSGRAASAGGKKEAASGYYKAAAAYPTTFYGQLAIAALASGGSSRSGDGKLRLPGEPPRAADASARLSKLELVHAARILQDLGRDRQRWMVMLHLADILDDPADFAALSDLALKFGDRKLSLRVAKSAALRNIVLADYAYPVAGMPKWTQKGPPVEMALVYGLSRQESEFDPDALSPAGARGLMQLMPRTARMVAKQIGVPYAPGRLSDPVYNATLGAAHLGDLVQNEFAGSYIMSIAAYNAGASRVRQWVTDFGDPRSTQVDPIDWIENIPFSETRNYVQRVMENTEVYRSRLSGKPETVRIDADIRRHVGAPITTPAPTPRPANLPLAAPTPASAAPVVAPATGAPAPTMAPMAPPGAAASPASMAPVIEAEDKSKPRTLR